LSHQWLLGFGLFNDGTSTAKFVSTAPRQMARSTWYLER